MIAAREAFERLREGNGHFVSGARSSDILRSQTRRSELAAGQEQFAIILGCSDSRVPAEMVFDQGLGDLFVIRVAGNIVASSQVGSVEFAAARFGWWRFWATLSAGPSWQPWKNFSSRRIASRGTCVQSSTAFGHPWNRCSRQSSGTTRALSCGRPCGPDPRVSEPPAPRRGSCRAVAPEQWTPRRRCRVFVRDRSRRFLRRRAGGRQISDRQIIP